MAGKQHEIRPEQESPRKGQISDETGRKYLKCININYPTHESGQNASENSPKLRATDFEETMKNGTHFYTLPIMNETNRVIF